MGGDADAFFYPEVLVDKDNPYLERFITFLKACSKAYPSGKGGYEDYSHIPDYALFCSEDYPDEMIINGTLVKFSNETEELFDQEYEKCGISFEWESSYDYFGESSFRGVTVSYFDENGDQYRCELE